MVPKMRACLDAVNAGVSRATVVDGREPHAVLLELFTKEGVGTQVLPGVETKTRKARAAQEDVMIQERYAARYAQSLMNTFGPPKLTLVRGEGAHVWDADGKEYVDLLGGIAVNALGHGHPALVAAVTTQLQTLGHVSNFFATEPQIELAEKLLALLDAGPGKVFFTNSGAEANEAAFKLTRRTGRTHVVAAEGGFHGRTMGALALTSKAAYREPFEPLPGDVTFVPYGDVRRARGGGHRPDRGDPARADPGRGRRRRPARRLPRGRAADRGRARRPALARRDPDRDGPHRAVVRAPRQHRRRHARHRDRGQGAGRRLPDRRLRRRSARPASCSSRATTAPPSAATRSPAPPRSR